MEEEIREKLSENYGKLKEIFERHKIDINTVKVAYKDDHLMFYSREFDRKVGGRKFADLETDLGHYWGVDKDLSGIISIWGNDPRARGTNFVDLDPKHVESQNGAKNQVSQVRDAALDEIKTSRPLSPLSPSEIRVR